MEILAALLISGLVAAATDTGRKTTKAAWKAAGARRGVVSLGERAGDGARRAAVGTRRGAGAVARWLGRAAVARAERRYVARAVAEDAAPPMVWRAPDSVKCAWCGQPAKVCADEVRASGQTQWMCIAHVPAENPSGSSRRWDGKPETEADRKFFDLRESGYTGFFDQDGNKISDEDVRSGAWMKPRQRDANRAAAVQRFFDLRRSGYIGPIDQDGNKVTSGPHYDLLQRLQRPPTSRTNSNATAQEDPMTEPRRRGKAVSADPNGVHVAEYEPETLSELLLYCEQMARANQTMSEATADFSETLIGTIGLDPEAVGSVADIGEQYSEVAEAWQDAAGKIRARYELVIEHVESGGTLPKDPGFIDGAAA